MDSELGTTVGETLKGSSIKFENKGNTENSVGLTGKIVLATADQAIDTDNYPDVSATMHVNIAGGVFWIPARRLLWVG